MARGSDELIKVVTDDILNKIKAGTIPRDPNQIANETINDMENLFLIENANRGQGNALHIPRRLQPGQIATFINEVHNIVCIPCSGINGNPDSDLLASYVDDPADPDYGTYVESYDRFHRMAREFNPWLKPKECDDIIKILHTIVRRAFRCTDPDLIAVNNGIFDYKKKVLMRFSPEYVFMAKSHVNYNTKALNVNIHNPDDNTDWDVESWIDELSDDPEVVDLIWQLLGAVVRPNVPWNISAWLLSDAGNNGKGTLCSLMRSLCGMGAAACISLEDFSKEFALEPLMRATAIIVDENSVGIYIDKVANLKAVITGDVIPINRKHKPFISFQFHGFMVQCLNGFPRIKDKSDSFYRRQLFVPFNKCFTGRERKYIKEDYLKRPEVLEYVLYRVLHMTFYKLSEPQCCKDVLLEYKEFNDPVRQFLEDFEEQFVWDLLPFTFLYPLYVGWSKKNNPGGKIQGRNTFIREIVNVAKTNDIWCCPDQNQQITSKGLMDKYEPLIIQYDLGDWKNPDYVGSNSVLIAQPKLSPKYRGLTRRSAMHTNP